VHVFVLNADCVFVCVKEVDGGPRAESRGLQQYLVAYVNAELQLAPPLPSQGKSLYDTCSDATNLWSVTTHH